MTTSLMIHNVISMPGAEHDEEGDVQRHDDPTELWPDDWAAGAPWHSFASHTDPIGTALPFVSSKDSHRYPIQDFFHVTALYYPDKQLASQAFAS